MKKTKPIESVDLKAARKFREKFEKICEKIASTEGAKQQAERVKLRDFSNFPNLRRVFRARLASTRLGR